MLALVLVCPTLVAGLAGLAGAQGQAASVEEDARIAPSDDGASQTRDPEITDPGDDARIYNSNAAFAASGCGSDEPFWCVLQDRGDPKGGIPAPPALELTSASFQETPNDVIVRLEVESLGENLSEAAPEDGDRGTIYGLCWTSQATDPCQEQVYLQLQRGQQHLSAHSALFTSDDRCADVVPCLWEIPYEIESGTPGAIVWEIPRTLLPSGEAGDVLEQTQAFVFRANQDLRSSRLQVGPGEGFIGSVGGQYSYLVDSAGFGEDVPLEGLASGYLPPELREPVLEDPSRDFQGAYAAHLDIHKLVLLDEPDRFGVALKKAQVREDPTEHRFGFALGYGEEIPLLNAGYYFYDGQRRFYGGGCPTEACENYTDIDVNVSVEPGSPGWMNFTFPASELRPSDVDGLNLTRLGAITVEWEDRAQPPGPDVSPFLGDGLESYRYDLAYPSPAFTIGAEPEAREAPTGATSQSVRERTGNAVQDESSDAQLPDGTSPTVDARSFEITKATFEADSPTTSLMTLSIADMQQVQVPPTWDAVFYATAVEVDEGQFMAGYYKQDPALGTSRQKFLCASDTAVLQDPPRDPNQVVWTTIDGSLNLQQGSNETEGGGSPSGTSPATITLQVPRECLGRTPAGPMEVAERGAGTFLIRNPGGQATQIERVDDATNQTAVTIESDGEGLAAASTGASPSFWTQPFGVENFWDITGIAGTIAASVFGAVLVRRRRTALKDYLEEIEEIEEAYADDPSGRQAALKDLRSRANDDLVDGRLTENQYVVVKDRVAEEISEARMEGLEEAFGGLPHRLLVKLQELLQDGRLSPEDRRLFLTMLEDSGLNEEAKARVRRKLDIWVDGSSDRADVTA